MNLTDLTVNYKPISEVFSVIGKVSFINMWFRIYLKKEDNLYEAATIIDMDLDESEMSLDNNDPVYSGVEALGEQRTVSLFFNKLVGE